MRLDMKPKWRRAMEGGAPVAAIKKDKIAGSDIRYELTDNFSKLAEVNDEDIIWCNSIEELYSILKDIYPVEDERLERISRYDTACNVSMTGHRRIKSNIKVTDDELAELATYGLIIRVGQDRVKKMLGIENFNPRRYIESWRKNFVLTRNGELTYDKSRARRIISSRKVSLKKAVKECRPYIYHIRTLYSSLGTILARGLGYDYWSISGGKNREEYIRHIANFIRRIRKNKVNLHNVEYYSKYVIQTVLSLKPFAEALVKHEDKDYVELGKFIKREIRNKKLYKEIK